MRRGTGTFVGKARPTGRNSYAAIIPAAKRTGYSGRFNKDKYPNQWMYIVEVYGYAYAVPFVEHNGNIFLKTIIPSRKFTRKYLKK